MTRDATGRLGLDLVARSYTSGAPDATPTGAPASGWFAFVAGAAATTSTSFVRASAPRHVDVEGSGEHMRPVRRSPPMGSD